jgi:hypothetical protein
VYAREALPGGDVRIGVYTSAASRWNFGKPVTPPATCTTLRITTTALPAGSLGHAYSKALSACGGTAPYKWKKVGKLPKGLKLNPKSGVISGTPKKSTGRFGFSVQVSDKAKPKHAAARAFTVTVS